MRTFLRFVSTVALVGVTGFQVRVARAETQKVEVPSVGVVTLDCATPGGWRFDFTAEKASDGADVVRVRLTADRPEVPPVFDVRWSVSQRDVHHLWTPESTHYGIPWGQVMSSEVSSWMPLYAFLDANDGNRYTYACTESCRHVEFRSPINEVAMALRGSFRFFAVPEAPIAEYETAIRFDARPIFYGEAIAAASDWMCREAGIVPMRSCEAAFDPLYSSWYVFHQDVSSDLIEEECRLAAELGMKSVITDDGWQIDLPLGNREWGGYRLCGDWKNGRNFPDMAEHVRRVQNMGLKYLLWYSVPFVGEKSSNFARFKGKYLPVENCCAGAWTLDPRFPEVREFLVSTYEQALKSWNLDGFKLDFIGRFTLKGIDPAIAENYAGRDIKSIPLAVERLMTDVMTRLQAIKPDILIEFRQPYIGPCIRRFGNMIRAADCPCSMVENRTRIARLRLTSGETAVHADMLEWRADETPESAARCILNSIFGVVQYSVRLKTLPESQRRMVAHWIRFSQEQRAALLQGAFRPHYPASDYPLLEGESAKSRVLGVYQDGLIVPTGSADRPVYLLNAANVETLTVDFAAIPARVEAFDTFGNSAGTRSVASAGISRVPVPRAGYLRVEWPANDDTSQDILIEAESFVEKGGWVTDTQFMDQMGSPFLLAHGLGKRVADAKTSFEASSAGVHIVYVRTRNWNAPWSSHPAGLFQVSVNGVELPTTLGAGASEWTWRRAGEAVLSKGMNTVALQDLTGFDGRCDAIVFAAKERTSAELDAFHAAEQAAKPEARKTYDFVVVGGGVAGICAAVTAARQGLRTALVHDRPVLGGNNSSEVRVHLGAYANLPPYPRLGDVLVELAPATGGNARSAEVYEDARKLAVVKAEKNVDLYLNTHANAVENAPDGAIAAVVGVNVETGDRTVFAAPLFADTTGDGTIGYLAGADFRMGREGRSEYGEPWAPETGDTMTMGASVQWRAVTNGVTTTFPAASWMLPFNEQTAHPGLRGDWNWETGLKRNQISEFERVRDYGLLVVFSNWSYVKNAHSNRADFASAELDWVAYNAGKRESRRLLGDFVLTENHLMNREVQPDGTCATTWTIDQHFPKEASVTGFAGEAFQADSHNHRIWPYPIPYRCFYSRNVPNLFMAGRDISVSHVALGTTRLMRTHGMMGEVVGLAAAVCFENACRPRAVYERHFDRLKAKMEKGAGDGKVHPSQTYNCQRSLDPDISAKVQQLR